MNRAEPSNVASWRELMTSYRDDAAEHLRELESEGHALAALEGVRLEMAFASCDGVLAEGVALAGASIARGFVNSYHPHLARLMTLLARQPASGDAQRQWLANFALIAECMGVPRPQGFDAAALKPLLAARAEFSDARQRSMAFTSLALGDTATALAFVDEKPAPYDAPVIRVEFNQLELIRYLAAALDARRPADWIEPVWVEYFHLFPLHLEAEAAEWPDLFNFARVLANVRGDKISTIADDVHARVLRAAQSQA